MGLVRALVSLALLVVSVATVQPVNAQQVPTDTTDPSYQTRNGPRTVTQLLNELDAAGYSGPWELDAMLAAFDRAAAPTPTARPSPQPTATPTTAGQPRTPFGTTIQE